MKATTTLSDTDADRLLKFIADPPAHPVKPLTVHRDYLLTVLMLHAGLRVGELVQLAPRHLLQPAAPGGLHPYLPDKALTGLNLEPSITKSHIPRWVPLSPLIQFAVCAHFSSWYFLQRTSWPPYTFPTGKNENHITTRQVERIIKNYGLRALQRPLWPHMLRHSFATRVLRNSNTRTVQQLLGHKKLSSTQIYTHPTTTDLRDAIDRMAQPKEPRP